MPDSLHDRHILASLTGIIDSLDAFVSNHGDEVLAIVHIVKARELLKDALKDNAHEMREWEREQRNEERTARRAAADLGHES